MDFKSQDMVYKICEVLISFNGINIIAIKTANIFFMKKHPGNYVNKIDKIQINII